MVFWFGKKTEDDEQVADQDQHEAATKEATEDQKQQGGSKDPDRHENEKVTLKQAANVGDAVAEDQSNIIRIGFNKIAQKISGHDDIEVAGPDQAIQQGISKAATKVVDVTDDKLQDEEDKHKVQKAAGKGINAAGKYVAKRVDEEANLLESSPQMAATNAVRNASGKAAEESERRLADKDDDSNKLVTTLQKGINKGASALSENVNEHDEIGISVAVKKGISGASGKVADKSDRVLAEQGDDEEQPKLQSAIQKGANKAAHTLSDNLEDEKHVSLETLGSEVVHTAGEKAVDTALDKKDEKNQADSGGKGKDQDQDDGVETENDDDEGDDESEGWC